MSLGFGALVTNSWLDCFMESEGYEKRNRLYHPVIKCWCGNSHLACLNHAAEAFSHYQLCTACGCLLLKYVLPEESLNELYGIRYFREHQKAIGLPSFHERYINDARDRIPVWLNILREYLPMGAVLEVGCSHGRFLHELSALGYDVVGLELDEELCNWARNKTKCDIRASVLSALTDHRFDAVFANDVLEHVYDPRRFISDANGVLKDGGKIFFQTVIFETWQQCPANMLRPLFHTILYKNSSITNLAGPHFKHIASKDSIFDCKMAIFSK